VVVDEDGYAYYEYPQKIEYRELDMPLYEYYPLYGSYYNAVFEWKVRLGYER